MDDKSRRNNHWLDRFRLSRRMKEKYKEKQKQLILLYIKENNMKIVEQKFDYLTNPDENTNNTSI